MIEANEMIAVTVYTQIHRPRSEDLTTKAEPIVPFSTEQATHSATAIRPHVGSYCLYWTRGRYTKRYIALGP